MCNCISDIKKELEERVKLNPKYQNLSNISITSENVALIFEDDNVVRSKPYMSYKLTGQYETRNGTTRTKKDDLNVTFTYCPFCGEKI